MSDAYSYLIPDNTISDTYSATTQGASTVDYLGYRYYGPAGDTVEEVYEYDSKGRLVKKTVTTTPRPTPYYHPYQSPQPWYQQPWQLTKIWC